MGNERQIAVRRPGLVLDLGSGPGDRVGQMLPDARVIRADMDPAVQPEVVCDVHHLPFADKSVDWVFSRHVLEHVPWPQIPRTVVEWARVLKPNGVLDVAVPDMVWAAEQVLAGDADRMVQAVIFGSQADEYQQHRVGLTEPLLAGMMQFADLEVLQRETRPFSLSLHIETDSGVKRHTQEAQEVHVMARKKEEKIL